MKRSVTTALPFVLVAATLIGCEQSPQSNSGSAPPSAPAPTPTPTPAPVVVDQAKVEAYLADAGAAELKQIIERKQLMQRYIAAADEAQLATLVATPEVHDRLVQVAGDDFVAAYLDGAGPDAMRRFVEENELVDRYLQIAEQEEVLAVVETVRARVTERLLAPGEKHIQTHAAYAGGTSSGVARLLVRGRYDGLVEGRGGGAYYSFTTRSNDYDKRPDLQFRGGAFTAGFTGQHSGCVRNLEGVTFADASAVDMPEIIVTDDLTRLASEGRGADCAAAARVGAVFGVRSHYSSDHDTIGVFEVLEIDDDGVTIVWRTIDARSASAR